VKEKITVFATIIPSVLVLDLISKNWALDTLGGGSRSEIFGGFVPLTLAYNRGAAFGISLGDDSRWFFIPITILAVILLLVLLKQAARRDWLRLVSISMVVAGALGNLYDRVRWDRGVVDFIGPIDLGIMMVIGMAIGMVLMVILFQYYEEAIKSWAGYSWLAFPLLGVYLIFAWIVNYDWPIFNVADMSITCGAVLLAISFWEEERRERAEAVVRKEGEPTAIG